MFFQILDDFAMQVPSNVWPTATPETINFPALDPILNKYQNPREADSMTKIQAELDETKIILVSSTLNYWKHSSHFL